jgi:hypothetical protein
MCYPFSPHRGVGLFFRGYREKELLFMNTVINKDKKKNENTEQENKNADCHRDTERDNSEDDEDVKSDLHSVFLLMVWLMGCYKRIIIYISFVNLAL